MSENVVSGGKSSFKKYTRGYGEYFFEQAEKFKDKIFQIDGVTGQKETYSSALLRSTRLAIGLKKLGVAPNDVVLSCTRNTLDTVIPHLATLYLGAVISAVAPVQTPKEWTHCMKIVKPKFVFVEGDLVEGMLRAVEALEVKPGVIVMGKSKMFLSFDGLMEPSEEEGRFRPATVGCHDTAFVLYSSGTTGLSKGVCVSHFKIINEARSLVTSIPDASVTLNYAILFWISAVLLLTVTIQSGGSRLILPQFQAEELFLMIQKYKVSLFFSPPTFAYELTEVKTPAKYDTSSLKLYLIGGSRLSSQQLAKTRALFEGSMVSFVYGCTEVACFSTYFDFSRDKDLLGRLDSVGKPIEDVDIKVVDSETNQPLGCHARGEIRIKTIYATRGYYGIDSSPYFDEQGFFKTGDIGYYDAQNCFYIIDRLKDMFKYQNWHVVPSALEAVLLEHPQVKEAGVFGMPDEKDGFLPAACVVLQHDVPRDVGLLVRDIVGFFNERVSDFQRLRGGLKVVGGLPRTPSSKLQRVKLLELFHMS